MSALHQYDSSVEFQERITASIIRDEKFVKSYFTCISPEFFQQTTHKVVVREAINFFKANARLPDRVELEHYVIASAKKETTNSDYLAQLVPVYQRDIGMLYEIPVDILRTSQQYAVEFARKEALRLALLKSIQTLSEPDALEKTQKRLRDASMVGFDSKDLGLDYFATARERHQNRLTQPVEAMRVPFLIPKLDALIGGVGYRKYGGVPEMCVFLAPTNRGKSRALVHCAKVSALLGLNVMIFSAEMAAELYAERLDMSMGLLSTSELYDPSNSELLLKRLGKFSANQGSIHIKKYPSRQATIADTVAYIHNWMLHTGLTPHVLIYDYIDEFAPPDTSDQRRHDLSAITSAMRAVGDEFGAAVYTATQGNRESLSKDVVDLQHIAEDIGKANIADLIISLCQTEDETKKSPPEQRWIICKNRSGTKGQVVRVVDKVDKMQFYQHPEEGMDEFIKPMEID